MFNIMEPTFNVRQQSGIYIGPTSDILPGVLPEGRMVVVSDATIDRLYHPMLAPYDTVLIGLGAAASNWAATGRLSCWGSGAVS